LDVLRRHCEAEDRDYDEIERTCAFGFDVGENGEKAGELIGQLRWLSDMGIETVIGVVPNVDRTSLWRSSAARSSPRWQTSRYSGGMVTVRVGTYQVVARGGSFLRRIPHFQAAVLTPSEAVPEKISGQTGCTTRSENRTVRIKTPYLQGI
jgi:hypothetical protein